MKFRRKNAVAFSLPPIDDENRVGWQSAVDAIDELFSELTAAGFCAEDVGLLAGELLPSHEVVRWQVLTQIEKAFLSQIAARTPKAAAPPDRLVLAAVGDPPGRLAAMDQRTWRFL